MADIKKPTRPLEQNGVEFYPVTIADQVITDENTNERLSAALNDYMLFSTYDPDKNGSVLKAGTATHFSVTEIINGTDLNSIQTPGFYRSVTDLVTQSLKNAPLGVTQAFGLIVGEATGAQQILITWPSTNRRMFFRTYDTDNFVWGDWTEVSTIENGNLNVRGTVTGKRLVANPKATSYVNTIRNKETAVDVTTQSTESEFVSLGVLKTPNGGISVGAIGDTFAVKYSTNKEINDSSSYGSNTLIEAKLEGSAYTRLVGLLSAAAISATPIAISVAPTSMVDDTPNAWETINPTIGNGDYGLRFFRVGANIHQVSPLPNNSQYGVIADISMGSGNRLQLYMSSLYANACLAYRMVSNGAWLDWKIIKFT